MGKLVEISKTYVGTPHINGGNVKGAGLDCCTLVTNIYKDMGWIDVSIPFFYSGDWYCQKEHREYVLAYLKEYCKKVDALQEGDIISYRWGRSDFAHLAIYLGDGRIIHCAADAGVEITDINDPKLIDAKGNSRATGYWRLKHGTVWRK